MKKINPSALIFLMFMLTTGRAFCQDRIYRNDGTVLNVQIISIENQTIRYRLPDGSPGRIFYLSSLVIDSISHENGTTQTFLKPDIPSRTIKRNYVGTDLFNTCFGNPNITYERLSPSGITGFYAELLINLNFEDFYGIDNYWKFTNNMYLNYDPFSFFLKTGFSYYPFNCSLKQTGTIRVFTGASLLLGEYKKVDYGEYYYYGEYSIRFTAIISLNLGIKIYLADWLQIKADLELSVIPFLVFNSPEVGITIGF